MKKMLVIAGAAVALILFTRGSNRVAKLPANVSDSVAPIIEESSGLRCHLSYSGRCLDPDASDYDCAGGSGNGPYYTGKVRVVGPDVFGLDRDKDGWGCE